MYRSVINQLCEWKDREDRKPLIITGVRQCGKTYVCKQFGEDYFEDFAYFNFEENELLSDVFKYDFDVNRIIDELGNVINGKPIVPGKTLVIFDEAQKCPEVITSLKYFCENMRKLHIICVGSLLGIAIKKDKNAFPVGKINRIQMYPMSFYEFVVADGGERCLNGISGYPLDKRFLDIYSVPLMKYLKTYYTIGGMPEAVYSWSQHHNYDRVDEILENILIDYRNDFAKHAPNVDIPKLNWIWDSIPKQLAKDNNKFVFSHVKEGKRAKDLEDALEWLIDAGLIHKLELIKEPGIPLKYSSDPLYFKIYMSDIGLLRKKSGISCTAMLNDVDLDRNYKGACTENYVFTELLHQKIKPYFWRSGNTAELDFIFEQDDAVIPVEVKSQMNTRAKSYATYVKKYKPSKGIIFSMKNAGCSMNDSTQTYNIPLYLVWRAKEI